MATFRLLLPSLLAASLLVVPAPARAGGVDPCNSDYHRVTAAPLVSATGVTVGRMRLLAKPGTKEFCGRFHVSRAALVPGTKVVIGMGVASATQDSGLGLETFPAAHVLPIAIDAHGYPKGSTVTYQVTVKGTERTTGTVTAPVT